MPNLARSGRGLTSLPLSVSLIRTSRIGADAREGSRRSGSRSPEAVASSPLPGWAPSASAAASTSRRAREALALISSSAARRTRSSRCSACARIRSDSAFSCSSARARASSSASPSTFSTSVRTRSSASRRTSSVPCITRSSISVSSLTASLRAPRPPRPRLRRRAARPRRRAGRPRAWTSVERLLVRARSASRSACSTLGLRSTPAASALSASSSRAGERFAVGLRRAAAPARRPSRPGRGPPRRAPPAPRRSLALAALGRDPLAAFLAELAQRLHRPLP